MSPEPNNQPSTSQPIPSCPIPSRIGSQPTPAGGRIDRPTKWSPKIDGAVSLWACSKPRSDMSRGGHVRLHAVNLQAMLHFGLDFAAAELSQRFQNDRARSIGRSGARGAGHAAARGADSGLSLGGQRAWAGGSEPHAPGVGITHQAWSAPCGDSTPAQCLPGCLSYDLERWIDLCAFLPCCFFHSTPTAS